MKKVEINLYYDDINNEKTKEFKIRYIIYGGLILISSIVLFILEFNNGYGISKILDNLVSFSMFVDMALGLILLIRAFTIKDRIKADNILNIENYAYKENEDGSLYIKKAFSIVRALHVVSLFANVSIVTCYGVALGRNDISGHLVISFIMAIIVFLLPIMAFISLDKEKDLYNKIEE